MLFVRENRYQRSTLSHELSPTLGQRKEFYEVKNRCRAFDKLSYDQHPNQKDNTSILRDIRYLTAAFNVSYFL